MGLVGSTGAALAEVGDYGVELEFAGDGGRRRVRLADCGGVRFEDAVPVRSFRWSRGQRHFPGWWWLATTGRHVGYESWLERDHLMLLDFDPAVTAVSSQPFWLHWQDGRRSRRHAPDFFARLADGTGVVIDVRADDRIEPDDAEAFEVTARACEAAGWRVPPGGHGRSGARGERAVAVAVPASAVRRAGRRWRMRCGGRSPARRRCWPARPRPGTAWRCCRCCST